MISALSDNATKKIVSNYNPQKIIIFLSYGHGEQRVDTDLDLLIVKDIGECFY